MTSNFFRRILLFLIFIITSMFLFTSCNKQQENITDSNLTSESASKNYDDVILNEEEIADNKKFVELFNEIYKGYNATNDLQQVFNNIEGKGICLRKIDDISKISSSEKLVDFFDKVKNKEKAEILVLTAEKETFQGDYLSYDGKNVSLKEKTIRTDAINNDENIKIKRTSTHIESIDYVAINDNGFMEFIHDEDDKNIFTSFSYKAFDENELKIYKENFNNAYMKKAEKLILKPFDEPDKIESKDLVAFFEDYVSSQSKDLLKEYKTFLSPLGEGVYIPFKDVKQSVLDTFYFKDEKIVENILKQSSFYDGKNTFEYTFGRGGGGFIAKTEKITLIKNDQMSVITNLYNSDNNKFVTSSTLTFKFINNEYKIYSNVLTDPI